MTNIPQTDQRQDFDGSGTARILGYAGALPFLGCVFAGGLGLDSFGFDLSRLLIGYAAIILSFLGGLHWGRVAAFGLHDQPAPIWLVWSVIPSLIGWAGLFLPVQQAAIVLSLCFLAALVIDLKLIAGNKWAGWMRSLRLHLTIVAVTSVLSLFIWG